MKSGILILARHYVEFYLFIGKMPVVTQIETIRENISDTETTLFIANESDVEEFVITSIVVSTDSGTVDVDLFVDNGSSLYYILRNHTVTSNTFASSDTNYSSRVSDSKAVVLNTNDIVRTRPSLYSGDYLVVLQIAKRKDI